ncbi:MAG TPA: AMP-binding protein [Planctomycetota bacterium]|jgi:long-chain acyl-CoA synthetase
MAEKLTVLDLLERTAQKTPDAPAIVLPDRVVSYRELLGSSQRLAGALIQQTSRPVVALFFPMVPEFVIAYFGVLYAGKQALPLNLLLPPEELKYIIEDSGADFILAPPPFVAKLAPLGVRVGDYAELMKNAPASAALPRPNPDDVCTLLYTSGTTGKPKGVELTQYNLASNALNSVETMKLDKDYRVLACLPNFHTFAITGTILAPITCGGSLTPMPRFEPEAALKLASAAKCNMLLMVPSMYRLLIRMQERRPYDMKHLRLTIAGGEALPREVAEQFEKTFGSPLLEGFGQTESGPVVSFNRPWDHKAGTIGKPITGVEIRIVDPESLRELPVNTTGELWVKSPSVMKGYHNRPEETAKTITADGWLRTGDMGEITPDGYIRITGRLREMVKVAGEMVFPAEVEAALLKHPAVAETGVAGFKDERKGEIVKAFVVLKEGQQASEDELLSHCRGALAAYKVPRTIEFRNELPKGPTGKVLRRLLK